MKVYRTDDLPAAEPQPHTDSEPQPQVRIDSQKYFTVPGETDRSNIFTIPGAGEADRPIWQESEK